MFTQFIHTMRFELELREIFSSMSSEILADRTFVDV